MRPALQSSGLAVRRGMVAAGLGLSLILCAAPARATENAASSHFRIAFSSRMFTEVNENDARASVKAWATSVARERGITVSADPRIVADCAALGDSLRNRAVDAAGITTADYFALESRVAWGRLFAATIGDDITDNYVLLVHRGSGINRFHELRGRRLLIHRHARTSLVDPWLETLLGGARVAPATPFLGDVSTAAKLSQTILPVFFRQAEACVVTRRGFETMAELNPQVGRDLRVLCESPAVIATVFCFRAGFESPEMVRLVDGLRELHLSAAGRQVLTLFQSDRLQEIPAVALAGTRQLLESGRAARMSGQQLSDNSPNRAAGRPEGTP